MSTALIETMSESWTGGGSVAITDSERGVNTPG